jgi:hypothetical protein
MLSPRSGPVSAVPRTGIVIVLDTFDLTMSLVMAVSADETIVVGADIPWHYKRPSISLTNFGPCPEGYTSTA